MEKICLKYLFHNLNKTIFLISVKWSKSNNMEDGALIYRIFHFLRMAKEDINFFSPKVNPLVKKKAENVSKQIDVFEDELKARIGSDFNSVFQDFSNEKIYAIQSVMEKMFRMDESQCLEFENSLETIEK